MPNEHKIGILQGNQNYRPPVVLLQNKNLCWACVCVFLAAIQMQWKYYRFVRMLILFSGLSVGRFVSTNLSHRYGRSPCTHTANRLQRIHAQQALYGQPHRRTQTRGHIYTRTQAMYGLLSVWWLCACVAVRSREC